ncbi:YcaO-like family protein [Roseomonas sp. SSH11]|uniref:YcaO-like family protein n=1 Tax=Pararoseomonas baculiformis TaxID=2820812 RepID=A0ABS4AFS2_9PROT|nr:YcaO-like family protein [Pararoseomonas baculiformis]MBP0445881.1 YcaO-like family protein [Pararoseomonas baculiformis]
MSDELRRVADAFRATMPKDAHVTIFRIDHLDRTGIPVVQANLILENEPATTGYGYGFTEVEAEVGALGELCEEVHCGVAVKQLPRVMGSYAELSRSRAVIDPLTLCLPAGSRYAPEMELSWVEARRWPSGEAVLVPREWVAAYPYQLGEAPRLITPITNGLGAGFDMEHAIAHGIMEALQRDGNVLSYRALDQGAVVEPDAVPDPQVRGLLDHLRSLGIDVMVKLAATDFGMANLYVVGDDRGRPTAPIQVTSCGEAVSPDRDRTLRKALLEFCGSRARKAATHGPIPLLRASLPADYVERQIGVAMYEEEESRALDAMVEWMDKDAAVLRGRLADNVLSSRSRRPFSSLPTVPAAAVANSGDRLALLVERLAAEGLEVLTVDCSPPDHAVRVVKVIVPGLESETMSYHRIGWRGVRRLRDRSDPLILSAPREGAKRVRLRPEDEARCGGPAWFDAALADRLVGTLYPLYRESGTFSAQLALAAQRGEAVPA